MSTCNNPCELNHGLALSQVKSCSLLRKKLSPVCSKPECINPALPAAFTLKFCIYCTQRHCYCVFYVLICLYFNVCSILLTPLRLTVMINKRDYTYVLYRLCTAYFWLAGRHVLWLKLLNLLISHPSLDLCTGSRLMNELNINCSHSPTNNQPT